MVIPAMLQAGDLPWGDQCALCDKPTADICYLRVVCDQAGVETSSRRGLAQFVLISLLAGWVVALFASRMHRPGESRQSGKDVQFSLPVRGCQDCARGVGEKRWKQAIAKVPICAALLAKYPGAKVTLKGFAK